MKSGDTRNIRASTRAKYTLPLERALNRAARPPQRPPNALVRLGVSGPDVRVAPGNALRRSHGGTDHSAQQQLHSDVTLSPEALNSAQRSVDQRAEAYAAFAQRQKGEAAAPPPNSSSPPRTLLHEDEEIWRLAKTFDEAMEQVTGQPTPAPQTTAASRAAAAPTATPAAAAATTEPAPPPRGKLSVLQSPVLQLLYYVWDVVGVTVPVADPLALHRHLLQAVPPLAAAEPRHRHERNSPCQTATGPQPQPQSAAATSTSKRGTTTTTGASPFSAPDLEEMLPLTAKEVESLSVQMWQSLHNAAVYCTMLSELTSSTEEAIDEEENNNDTEDSGDADAALRKLRINSLAPFSTSQWERGAEFTALHWLFVAKCAVDMGYSRGEFYCQLPHRCNIDELLLFLLWVTHRYGFLQLAVHFRHESGDEKVVFRRYTDILPENAQPNPMLILPSSVGHATRLADCLYPAFNWPGLTEAQLEHRQRQVEGLAMRCRNRAIATADRTTGNSNAADVARWSERRASLWSRRLKRLANSRSEAALKRLSTLFVAIRSHSVYDLSLCMPQNNDAYKEILRGMKRIQQLPKEVSDSWGWFKDVCDEVSHRLLIDTEDVGVFFAGREEQSARATSTETGDPPEKSCTDLQDLMDKFRNEDVPSRIAQRARHYANDADPEDVRKLCNSVDESLIKHFSMNATIAQQLLKQLNKAGNSERATAQRIASDVILREVRLLRFRLSAQDAIDRYLKQVKTNAEETVEEILRRAPGAIQPALVYAADTDIPTSASQAIAKAQRICAKKSERVTGDVGVLHGCLSRFLAADSQAPLRMVTSRSSREGVPKASQSPPKKNVPNATAEAPQLPAGYSDYAML